MSSTTSLATIQSLRNMFACFGLPEQVITDNGRNFVSEEFKELLQKNGIKHTTSATYHTSTNGLAECAVETFKQGLTKLKEGPIYLDFCSTTELPLNQQQELLLLKFC